MGRSTFSIIPESREFQLGGLTFDRLENLQETAELTENESKVISKGVMIVATLYDESSRPDWHNWELEILKETKLQELDELFRKKEILPVKHPILESINFRHGKLVSRQIEALPGLIQVTMNIKEYGTLEETEEKRNPKKLRSAENATDTKKATETKNNQIEADKKEANALLAKVNSWLKEHVWD